MADSYILMADSYILMNDGSDSIGDNFRDDIALRKVGDTVEADFYRKTQSI